MAHLGPDTGAVAQFCSDGNPPAKAAHSETRSTQRRRVLKGGIVAFNERFSTLPCMIRDISATGARLRIDGSINAPDTFELIVELDGLEADCEVVWRKGSEIGVRFTSPPRTLTPRRTQVVDALATEHKPSLRRKPRV